MPSRPITLNELVAWLREPTPTLIVAGAGLSIPQPTAAPGVWQFLGPTTELLHERCGFEPATIVLPNPLTGEPEPQTYVDRLFPEACYGAIAEVFGRNDHLKMWEVLDADLPEDDPPPPLEDSIQPRPNIAHRMVVDLSSRFGWPILTTNFDCFIERAADEAAIDVNDQVARSLEDRIHVSPRPGVATLIKIHGTAKDFKTVRSTAADLSRCSRIVRRMHIDPVPRRLLVIGYSGKDFDLFPWLTETFADVAWVDLAFPADHRAHTIDGALTWAGDVAELALACGAAAPTLGNRPDDRKVAFRALAGERAVAAHRALFDDHPAETAAALVGVLDAVGSHHEVIAVGTSASTAQFRLPNARLQLLLALAGAHSSIDSFAEAKRWARRARWQALRLRSISGLGRASIALTYAKTTDQWLNLPVRARFSRARLARMLTPFGSVVVTTAACAPIAAASMFSVARKERPPLQRYRLACEYIEHWVRLMALLEVLRRRHRVVGQSLDWIWDRLENRCSRVGYTQGLMTVSRYTSRSRVENEGTSKGATTRALMIGQSIGLATAYREAGRRKAEAARADNIARAESEALRAEASDLLNRALRYAVAAGTPSLEIKVRYLQQQFDLEPCLPLDIDQLLADGAGCAALQRNAAAIREAFVG